MKVPHLFTKAFILLLFIISIPFTLAAQIEHKENPISKQFNISKSEQLLDYTPSWDWALIAEQDDEEQKNGKPLRVGFSIPVAINMHEAGQWNRLPDGRMMWRLTLRASGATALGVVFNEYALPHGSKLFIYNPSQSDVLGALGSHNNSKEKVLSTRPIQGDVITIEYIEPYDNQSYEHTEQNSKAKLHIGELMYVYADILNSTETEKARPGASESCQVNINCSPVGDDWQDIKRGVTHIFFKKGTGWYSCSGTLINNTNQDETPYILTANHCGAEASASNKLEWVFYFNFEYNGCNAHSNVNQSQTVTGCQMVATSPINGGSDFLLLKLRNSVPSSYNPYFNGWSREPYMPLNAVCIHHPSGDVKKISTTDYVGSHGSALSIGGAIMPANSTWKVVWCENDNGWGVTEGGSSGSPLFNDDGYVIGTLSGGRSSCDEPSENDYFGKFNWHWDNYGTGSSSQLKDWLDPKGLGVSTLKGFDPVNNPEAEETIFHESFEGSQFPPNGWSLNPTVNSHTWKELTGFSIQGTSTEVRAQHGQKFSNVSWQNAKEQNEWLITPRIDLREKSNLELSFYFNGHYHWSVLNDYCDLTVKARVGNGQWADLWNEHHAQWSDNDNYQWQKVILANLSAYENKNNVQFAFVYTGKDGATFSIDNIKLYKTSASEQPTLLPPKNLSATLQNQKEVMLSWEKPSENKSEMEGRTNDNVTLKHMVLAPITHNPMPIVDATYTKRHVQKSLNLMGYKVYRNSSIIANISNPLTTTYADTDLANGSYSYYITAVYEGNRESEPSNEVRLQVATSVGSPQNGTTTIYPNPFIQTINLENLQGINRITLSNVMGQVIFDKAVGGESKVQINNEHLPTGIYILTLWNPNSKAETYRLVKY